MVLVKLFVNSTKKYGYFCILICFESKYITVKVDLTV